MRDAIAKEMYDVQWRSTAPNLTDKQTDGQPHRRHSLIYPLLMPPPAHTVLTRRRNITHTLKYTHPYILTSAYCHSYIHTHQDTPTHQTHPSQIDI